MRLAHSPHVRRSTPTLDLKIMAAASAFLSLYGAAAVLLFVSILYFRFAKTGTSLRLRFLTSAHGAVGAIVFLLALAIGFSGRDHPSYGQPYLVAWMLPASLTLVSLMRYPGPATMHLLQVFNVMAFAWAWFIGTMAVTGVWI